MKLSLLFIFVTMFSLQANDSYSQRKISLDMSDVSVKQLIDEIESQSDYRFVYKINDVDLNRKVEIKVKDQHVTSVLDQVFSSTQTKFEVVKTQIILTKKNNLTIDNSGGSQESAQQQKEITGIIKSESGDPVLGVNIIIKGTSKGTQSNFEGNYTITAKEGDVLVFSYIGYKTQEIIIGTSNTINVVLEEDNELEEVVITAYGKQKKEAITGSVGVIKSDEVELVQQGNVLQGLTGKVAGVQISANSGQPGDPPIVNIRGLNSINSLTSPLYVIDGIPMEIDPLESKVTRANRWSGDDASFTDTKSNHLAFLNQNDIESVTILKDAEAAALYGSRSSNGVVVITTKKGKSGKPTVTVNTSLSVASPANVRPVIKDPARYYETYYQYMVNELERAGNADPTGNAAKYMISDFDGNGGDYEDYWLGYNSFNVSDDQLINPSTGKLNPNARLLWNDNWADGVFGSNITKKIHIGISGGNENTKYYFSLGNDDIGAYVKKTDFKRTTLNLSLDQKIKDKLSLNGKLSYTRSQKNTTNLTAFSAGNPIVFANSIAPIYPIYARNLDGSIILDGSGNRVYDYGVGSAHNTPVPNRYRPVFNSQNPLANLEQDKNYQSYNDLSGIFSGKYKILDGLSAQYNIAMIMNNSRINQFRHRKPYEGVNGNDTKIRNRAYESYTISHQQLINWNKTFKNHHLDVLIGHESNKQTFQDLNVRLANLLVPDVQSLNSAISLANGNLQESVRGYQWDYSVEGYLSRLQYDYNSKYFLSASYRRDGSSVFHKDNRWGDFYGIGAAWKISEESFLNNVDWLNNLRLKASFGQQGNDKIVYPYDDGINDGLPKRRNYLAYKDQWVVKDEDGNPTASLAYLGNKDLTWETTESFNTGIEASLFKNRVQLNAEYFVKNISDMIYNQPPIPSSARPSVTQNIGNMVNKGVEVSLGVKIIENDNVDWSFDINGTHVRNKITKLLAETDLTFNSNFRLEEGRSAFEYYLVEYAGVDRENGDPLYYLNIGDNPRETTNIYSDAEEVYVGKSAEADVYGGFSTYFRYKNFDLNTNFTYQIGGYGYDEVYFDNLYIRAGNAIPKNALDITWTPENTTAKYPRLGTNIRGTARLIDASYLSLQNIRLGYSLPEELTSKIGIDDIKLYASADNLFLISKRKGYDPRVDIFNSSSSYGVSRNVSFGLNFKF